MLEMAVYNRRQHDLFCRICDTFVLTLQGGIWRPVPNVPIGSTQPALEFRPAPDSVYVCLHGDRQAEQEDHCAAQFSSGRTLALPASLQFGDTYFEARNIATGKPSTRPALQELTTSVLQPAIERPLSHGPSSATLTRWFESLATVHHWIGSSQEFYSEAAQFVVDPIGLDGGIVLRCNDGLWEIVASYLPHPELGILVDTDVLEELTHRVRTLFDGWAYDEVPSPPDDASDLIDYLIRRGQSADSTSEPSVNREPLAPRRAVVVSPLVDAAGELVGAVYGFRIVHEGNARRRVRHLEARLVELLAGSLSAGLKRLEQDATAARHRSLIEQAFAPSVVEQITRDPTSLNPTEREITILFADLRNFSSICAALETIQSYDLLNEIMDCLTSAVMDHDGVVIDYYGDGLSAMWNAPLQQPDHPQLACQAALQMLATLPATNQQWKRLLPRDLRVGIGVHTGPAQVGNVGSRRRLKYGPRGSTVNLASRVEAATKKLRLPLLATGSTASRLSGPLAVYRVCKAKLRGVRDAIDLFSVSHPSTERRIDSELATYQRALHLYEEGRLDEAEALLARSPCPSEDVPTRFLAEHVRASRAKQLGRRSTDPEDRTTSPVIELDVT